MVLSCGGGGTSLSRAGQPSLSRGPAFSRSSGIFPSVLFVPASHAPDIAPGAAVPRPPSPPPPPPLPGI